MGARNQTFVHDGRTYTQHIACPAHRETRPLLLFFHAWTGQGDIDRTRAEQFSREFDVVAVACDMYGEGIHVTDPIECSKYMTPLMRNRNELQARALANVAAAKAISGADPQNVVAIGYCFGGLCVLDLARIGQHVSGVISVHGLFKADTAQHAGRPLGATPRVLALHGNDDPMVTGEEVSAFAQEMTALQRDFQIHIYGHARHGFTNVHATDRSKGVLYDERASRRATQSIENFVREIMAVETTPAEEKQP